MRFAILVAPEAVEDIRRLRAADRSAVQRSIERHLRHTPERTSRSRIKRLKGVSKPQYRLRIGEFRVFYDVSRDTVEVLAVVKKSEAEEWLRQFGDQA